MAVAVQDDLLADLRRLLVGRVRARKSLSRKVWLAEAGARVVGEEVSQLVAEDAGAAWLEHDDRHAGIDLRREGVEDADEIALGVSRKPKS